MRTKKCLQNFRGQLELGLSNQKSTKQWQFKFYNQALFNTVEVPVMTKHQIIAMSLTNHSHELSNIIRRDVQAVNLTLLERHS